MAYNCAATKPRQSSTACDQELIIIKPCRCRGTSVYVSQTLNPAIKTTVAASVITIDWQTVTAASLTAPVNVTSSTKSTLSLPIFYCAVFLPFVQFAQIHRDVTTQPGTANVLAISENIVKRLSFRTWRVQNLWVGKLLWRSVITARGSQWSVCESSAASSSSSAWWLSSWCVTVLHRQTISVTVLHTDRQTNNLCVTNDCTVYNVASDSWMFTLTLVVNEQRMSSSSSTDLNQSPLGIEGRGNWLAWVSSAIQPQWQENVSSLPRQHQLTTITKPTLLATVKHSSVAACSFHNFLTHKICCISIWCIFQALIFYADKVIVMGEFRNASCIFNFAILVISHKSEACKIWVFYSTSVMTVPLQSVTYFLSFLPAFLWQMSRRIGQQCNTWIKARNVYIHRLHCGPTLAYTSHVFEANSK